MAVTSAIRQRLADNLASVRARMQQAAQRSGRDIATVTLVAVTKYVDLETTRTLVELGCHDVGESRPQQLWEKAAAMSDLPVRWHLIGHLQRNKVTRVLPHVHLLHSLDSPRLYEASATWASEQRRTLPALLEVNVSGDANKHGFTAEQLVEFLHQGRATLHDECVSLCGLMTLASLEGGEEQARVDFAMLRHLRDRLVDQSAGRWSLPDLSMGMSHDFEVAIEEGATLVRVGSSLFEGIDG